MAFEIYNFSNNDDVDIIETGGPFSVIEYIRDLSCSPQEAPLKYYMSMQNVRRRQLMCELEGKSIILQPGALQWMVGDITQTTGIKGVGDAVGKMFAGSVTGEAAVKPEYKGYGTVVTEPTYRHYLMYNLANWEGSSMVVQDGMFCACEGNIQQKVIARKNVSSAVAGGKGIFNLMLKGNGYVILESDAPKEELITVDLDDDVLKVDGPYAVAWSPSLEFTVERSGKTLIGSAASGEGLVNVYRGTGRVIMMPQV